MLFMLSYSQNSAAISLAEMVEGEVTACEVGTSSSITNVSADNIDNDTQNLFTDSKSAWTADMELGNKSVTESYSFNCQRIRRDLETASFLKGIYLILSHYQNSLVLDQSKLYYSDKDPHYASFSSEYYVYTLRQILI